MRVRALGLENAAPAVAPLGVVGASTERLFLSKYMQETNPLVAAS